MKTFEELLAEECISEDELEYIISESHKARKAFYEEGDRNALDTIVATDPIIDKYARIGLEAQGKE